MLNFDFLEKGLGIVSPSHSVYDFPRKVILFYYILLHSNNWPNFIISLPLLREILANKCIVIVCESGCDIINFEINIIFQIKPVFLC